MLHLESLIEQINLKKSYSKVWYDKNTWKNRNIINWNPVASPPMFFCLRTLERYKLATNHEHACPTCLSFFLLSISPGWILMGWNNGPFTFTLMKAAWIVEINWPWKPNLLKCSFISKSLSNILGSNCLKQSKEYIIKRRFNLKTYSFKKSMKVWSKMRAKGTLRLNNSQMSIVLI